MPETGTMSDTEMEVEGGQLKLTAIPKFKGANEDPKDISYADWAMLVKLFMKSRFLY